MTLACFLWRLRARQAFLHVTHLCTHTKGMWNVNTDDTNEDVLNLYQCSHGNPHKWVQKKYRSDLTESHKYTNLPCPKITSMGLWRHEYLLDFWRRRVCICAGVFVVKCDATLLVCSGSFHHSLVLTSTAEPWGTFTTDLASHFQCCSGRPLLSVSAVPSSF